MPREGQEAFRKQDVQAEKGCGWGSMWSLRQEHTKLAWKRQVKLGLRYDGDRLRVSVLQFQ